MRRAGTGTRVAASLVIVVVVLTPAVFSLYGTFWIVLAGWLLALPVVIAALLLSRRRHR